MAKRKKPSIPLTGAENIKEGLDDLRKAQQQAAKRKPAQKKEKWIQNADIKKGALHEALGVPADQPIPASKLKVAPGDSAKMKKRKQLAQNFRQMNKGK